MELTFSYAMSQVFIIFSYLFLMNSYNVNTKTKIILYNMASIILTGLSYLCLGAYSGIAMSFVDMFRNILFFLYDKYNSNKDNITIPSIGILAIVYSLCILLAVMTYNSFLSLMPVFATMMYTYSIWKKNPKVYKWLGVPIGISLILYNIYIKSLFGIILEIILMLSAIIGLTKDKSSTLVWLLFDNTIHICYNHT